VGAAHRYSEFPEPSTCVEAEPPTWGELHPAFISTQRDVAIAKKSVILDGADQLHLLNRAGEIKLQDAVDGLCDIARNHGLRDAAVKDHRNRPPTRSDAPAGLSDEAAWAEFDRRERDRPAPPPQRPRPTPQVTVEAIMVAIRDRGLAALKEPAVRDRVQRCDMAARDQINQRIERLLARGEIQ
jgi:hypothetical protein